MFNDATIFSIFNTSKNTKTMSQITRVILDKHQQAPKQQKTLTVYFDADKKNSQVINPAEGFDERYLRDLVRSVAGANYHSYQYK